MADFEQLIDQFLCEEYEESPVNASGLGLIGRRGYLPALMGKLEGASKIAASVHTEIPG